MRALTTGAALAVALALTATAAHAQPVEWGYYDCGQGGHITVHANDVKDPADRLRLRLNDVEQKIAASSDGKHQVAMSFKRQEPTGISEVVVVADGSNVEQLYVGVWHEGNHSEIPDGERYCKLTGVVYTQQ